MLLWTSFVLTLSPARAAPEDPEPHIVLRPRVPGQPLVTTPVAPLTDWDEDGNGEVEQDEFIVQLGRLALVDRWDEDDDDALDDAELKAGLFDSLDADDNGTVTPGELLVGRQAWKLPSIEGLPSNADVDRAAWNEASWDPLRDWLGVQTSSVHRYAFAEALFRIWDTNGDNGLSGHEFGFAHVWD